MKRTLTFVVILALATSGCATARGQDPRLPVATSASYQPDQALMSSYIRQIPVGARVRVRLVSGQVVRGTLLRTDADPIVVQRHTRLPEPPLHVPIDQVQTLEIERNGGSTGRSIAIGAAVGAGAAVAVLALLAALFAD